MKPHLFLFALLATSCATEGHDGVDSSDASFGWLDHSDIQFDAPIPVDAEFAPDRIIVGFADFTRPARLQVANGELARQRTFNSIPAAVYTLQPGQDVRAVIEELRASGRYRWAEPDYVRYASVDDPYRSYQWHFDAIDAEAAWATSTGLGALVAVLDTGVSSGPYDGIGSLTTGYDFANGDSNAADDNGHGTHVSGTIAQATNNGTGVAGLAYDATILPVKVLSASGSGYTSDVVDGIDYAVSQGADVINMSLGSSSYSSAEAAAVLDAYTAGVFVACASGNSGSSSVDYPAGYSGAVAVGATRYGNVLASYSSRGSAMDLVAPGGDTSRDDNGDGYVDGVLQETFSGSSWGYYFFDGTSMATPHVAGAAALLMAAGATNDEAYDALTSTALDLGSAGWDSSYGYGLIQPADALAALDGGGGGGDPVDADGDGWDDTVDCDDGDPAVNPGATEVCGDGIDNDCDGVDDACPPVDADGDGWDDTVDCDDGDPGINPGAEDICGDGIDQDCSGSDAACSSDPTISDVSWSISRGRLSVSWTTDELTEGYLCDSRGRCKYSDFDTSHSLRTRDRGSYFELYAFDVDGNYDYYIEYY